MHQILKQKIRDQRHPLTIGFDPDVSNLHPFLKLQFNTTPIESFLVRWYQSTVSPISGTAHSIKFQSAFFEQFGPRGLSALQDIILDAKRLNLHAMLDAKRGDISTTMAAYGNTVFDHYQADSVTILPWMGTDSLRALLPWLKQGKGVYIVWLSSNASGRSIQMKMSENNKPIAQHVFEEFYSLACEENVTNQIGWVLGATDIPLPFIQNLPGGEHAFLLPGIGAQGAKFDSVTTSLRQNHPSSLFPISRGLLKPAETEEIHNWDDYSAFVAKRWNDFIRQSSSHTNSIGTV
jgi:orotidine 5'-phosphate decarboxylase subfamily 2